MSDYDTDVYAWSMRQSALLRRLAAGERVNDADFDWPTIADEIETVGRSERSAVASCVRTIIEHLMKLEASPATDPRAGWRATLRRERVRLEGLLDENPSLRSVLDAIFRKDLRRARALLLASLEEFGEAPVLDPSSLSYSAEQVAADWFPDHSS